MPHILASATVDPTGGVAQVIEEENMYTVLLKNYVTQFNFPISHTPHLRVAMKTFNRFVNAVVEPITPYSFEEHGAVEPYDAWRDEQLTK